jgi:hypothetical protein
MRFGEAIGFGQVRHEVQIVTATFEAIDPTEQPIGDDGARVGETLSP